MACGAVPGRDRDPEALFRRLVEGKDSLREEQFKKARDELLLFRDRPGIVERLFERLDADRDGSQILKEFQKLPRFGAAREGGPGAGGRPGPLANPRRREADRAVRASTSRRGRPDEPARPHLPPGRLPGSARRRHPVREP